MAFTEVESVSRLLKEAMIGSADEPD